MNKIIFSLILIFAFVGITNAQKHHKDSSTLKISGAADVYYKYDMAQSKNFIPATDNTLGIKQNSLDFGMVDLKIQKSVGKASIYTDLAFGPRPDTKPVDPQNSYHIQNFYLSYQLTKKLSFSAGAMYKYQSFEKITPADNFNYSMSKSWVQNFLSNPRAGGVRAIYVFNDMVRLNVGVYNSVDPKAPSDNVASLPAYGVSDFVAQLFVSPIKDLQLSAAYWYEAQRNNGFHTNFQANYKLANGWKLGLDATKFKCVDSLVGVSSYSSAVLYAQKFFGKIFSLGGRYEYMDKTEGPSVTNTFSPGYYNIVTFTLNEKLGPIALKEEVRFDKTNAANTFTTYQDKNGNPTDKATQLILAAIYAF